MEKFDAIIIGGGVAGSVAAYELSKHYPRVLLVEKERELGGMVASYHIDGFSIERYYHHFFSQDTQLLELSKEIRLESSEIWSEAPIGYYFDNRIFNLNTPFEILRYKYISLGDKFKLGASLIKLRHIDDLSSLDNITAKDWIVRNTSERVYENFFKPLLRSKFGDEFNISAAWLCARLKKRSNKKVKGEKLGYFDGGFETFFNAIESRAGTRVDFLKGTEAERIITEYNKVKGVVAGGTEYLSDVVISTVGPSTLLRLCDLPETIKQRLNKIKQQAVVCTIFGLKQSLFKPYWLNIKSDNLPFGILIEHNNFVDFSQYKGARIIYAVTYCNRENDSFFKKPIEDIEDIYIRSLEAHFNLRLENILWRRTSKTKEAGSIYEKGLLKLLPDIKSGISGLYLCGMIRSYPDRGINESITDAKECVDIILRR